MTDQDWADKAAIEAFYRIKGAVFMGKLPLYNELPPYVRAEVDAIASIIRSSAPDVVRLVEAVNLTLDVLNSWGSAKDKKTVPTPAEWAAYQGMVKGNYIDLAVRLRSALADCKPKVCERTPETINEGQTMKVSDVIKTPVRVKKGFGGGFSDPFDNWHIMNDSGTHMGKPCDVTIAECDSWEDAQAIAHCINSHDTLVGIVIKLRGFVEKYGGRREGHLLPRGNFLGGCHCGHCETSRLICEVDEVLKGEGPK